jgi:hypothetical protein
MIRNIKALGLAFVAVVAMAAMAASAAQAAPGELHVETAQKANLTGEIIAGQQHKLSVGSTTIQCSVANLEGTVSQVEAGTQVTATKAVVTATYSGCNFLGAATVRMNGCQYELVGTAELTSQAKVVNCTSGKSIEIIAAGGLCTITIGTQAALAHVVYENKAGPPKDAVANATVTGIVITRDGAFCPQGTASFTGNTTVRAFVDNGTEQVTEHSHQFNKVKCGAQVGVFGT